MTRKVSVMSELKGSVNFPKGTLSGTPGVDFVRKSDLIDGEYYYGYCRNSTCARWSETKDEFEYVRHKFGSTFTDSINHPEDDNGYDLFIPLFRCHPTKNDLVEGDVDDRAETIDEQVAKLAKGIP